MTNSIKEKLAEQLKKTQQNLNDSKEIGIKNLEQLSAEIKNSFDRAINSLNFNLNIFNELKIQRDHLKTWKISSLKTFFPINFRYVLGMPFIYGVFIPGLLFHLSLEIYHQICFRLYGIPRVKASDYFVYDRRLLPYLNWIEKLKSFFPNDKILLIEFNINRMLRVCLIEFIKKQCSLKINLIKGVITPF